MTDSDRIHQLEDHVVQLAAQIAGLIPVRLADAAGGTSSPTTEDFPIVNILNGSGALLPAGTVSGYGAPVTAFGAHDRLPTFQFTNPTAKKPFVILLADIANGQSGEAASVGTPETMVNVTDNAHEFADAITGDRTKLLSAKNGPARILKRSLAGVGLQSARVLLSSSSTMQLQFGEVYTAITAMSAWGTWGSGQVKFKNDDGTPDDNDNPITVENRYRFSFTPGDTVLCDRAFNPPRVYADKGAVGGQSKTRFARATTTISGATSNLAADWGSGFVRIMDEVTGVLAALPSVAVKNKLIGISFVTDAELEIEETAAGVLFVTSGTCAAVTWK